MTIKSQKNSGNASVVVIIILVVILIGALGFIFWQSFVNKKTTDTPMASNTTESESANPYIGWKTYTSNNSGYSIKYPKDWLALKETVQDGPYIRNFEPTSQQSQGGYPDGYINVRVLREENSEDFKASTGSTTTEWFAALGKTQVRTGPVSYLPQDVKELKISGLPAKSAKSVFTETNEVIYVLRKDTLYSINLYPYGISSDPTVKLMLDSFVFI